MMHDGERIAFASESKLNEVYHGTMVPSLYFEAPIS